MNQDLVLSLALPVTLFLMMFAMGTTLRPADFVELVARPGKVVVGLTAQLLLLPVLAYALLRGIPVLSNAMSPEIFVG
ncbi:MAG: hypothetical protein V2I24_03945, partial [Halieaceae bacterium]|nr:hypothetical protein [Halieaceae bacterium]